MKQVSLRSQGLRVGTVGATIPGTRRIERLEENCAAQSVVLQTQQRERLEALVHDGVTGARY